MGSGGGGGSNSCSSSGEEDGDADWRSAIDSVSSTVHSSFYPNGFSADDSKTKRLDRSNPCAEEDQQNGQEPPRFNHYQKKTDSCNVCSQAPGLQSPVQKYLYDMLEESLETVRNPINLLDNNPLENEGKIRLFKQSPLGIVFDHIDEYQRPEKKPRILPGEEIDEKSKEFRRQIESIAVDGIDIMAAARDACLKSVASLEAKDAAAKAAAKREEERVAALKKMRGERWPPSIAKEMGRKFRSCK